jgi:hypothetical protein
LADFLTVVEDFGVEHEDVVMRMFVSTLEGEARKWYKSLLMPPLMDGIRSKRSSLKDGQDKQDNFSLINAFTNIKKNGDETVTDFNACFSKTYYKFPITIRPNDACALIFYLEAFDGILGIFLRSKEPQTLEEAQVVAIKLERHFIAAYGFLPIHDFQPLVATKCKKSLLLKMNHNLHHARFPEMSRMMVPQA